MALTIDSPLGEILDNEQGKAVLEKHIPGISTLPQIGQARGMSLRTLAPMSQGRITEVLLNAINEDLGKI